MEMPWKPTLLLLYHHNLVFLKPTYKPCVLKLPVTTRSVRKWSPETCEALRDCFECTDWTVLLEPQDSNLDTDRRVDTLTEYIDFCRDTVVPAKTVRCYPNNKSWANSTIKQLLNQKKPAFKEGNKERLREVQHELKGRLRQAKVDYKGKVESNRFDGGGCVQPTPASTPPPPLCQLWLWLMLLLHCLLLRTQL